MKVIYIYIHTYIYATIVLAGSVPYFFIFLTYTYCVTCLAHPSPFLVHARSLSMCPSNTYISATVSQSLR
jgi:hypothetical protein